MTNKEIQLGLYNSTIERLKNNKLEAMFYSRESLVNKFSNLIIKHFSDYNLDSSELDSEKVKHNVNVCIDTVLGVDFI